MKAKFRVEPSYKKKQIFPVMDKKYLLIKKLGTGATCTVKLVKHKDSQIFYAAKIMKGKVNSKMNIDVHFQAEVSTLQAVKHANVVRMIDFNENGVIIKPNGVVKKVKYIILEFAANGELFDYVYYYKSGFDERIAAFIFEKILDGVEACHQVGVAHRDLKTENIIMDANYTLKIVDFGYATFFKPGELLNAFLGTISYVPPEILSRTPYLATPVDIFSCGVILFILVTARFPFLKATPYGQHYRYIYQNDFENFWKSIFTKIDRISEELQSLLNFLFALDPLTRPSISEIRNHPWMLKDKASEEEVIAEFQKRKIIVRSMKEKEIAEDNPEEIIVSDKERIVKEFSENEFNPYRVKVNNSDICTIITHVDKFFNKDERTEKITHNPNSAKITVQFFSSDEPLETPDDLMFEIEVKKSASKDEQWFLEFYKLQGDKTQFSEVFDNFVENASVN